MWQAKKIEQRPIDGLKQRKRNPKKHVDLDIDAIAKSIQEFGWLVPVLIDSSGELIAGHGRVSAAKKLGLKTVPCIIADHLTETQRRAYAIADNKLTELAKWDLDSVKLEFDDLKLDIDFALTGFSPDDFIDIKMIDSYDKDDKRGKNYFDTRSKGTAFWAIGAVAAPVNYDNLKKLETLISKDRKSEEYGTALEEALGILIQHFSTK